MISTFQLAAQQTGIKNATLSTYNICEATERTVPARSQLYHLGPIGVGTPAVESLTSYIMRLADAHCVSIRTLVVDQLFPLYGRSYLLHHSLRLFWDEQTRALNGINASTHDMVAVLKHLTHRSDLHLLTMLTWANVLPSRGLLRSHRAWCPLCYAKWRAGGQLVYEPLLWALEVVTVCPQHRQELHTRCPSCQSQLLPLEAQARPGYCGQCWQWLGHDSKEGATNPYESSRDLSREVWIATEVGQLLASAHTIAVPPTREHLVSVVSAYVDRASGGSNAALARLLSCSKYTVRDCCRGEQLLRLGTLLKLSETVGVSLLRLLTDETLLTCLPPISGSISHSRASYHGPYRRVEKAQLRQRLQAEIDNPTDPPKSFRAVAQELGFDLSYLARQCPDEAQVIKTRYEIYVKHRKQHLHTALLSEVQQIVTRLATDGIYPSQKRVAAMLSRPWFMRLPEAREAWRRLVNDLGSSRTERTT